SSCPVHPARPPIHSATLVPYTTLFRSRSVLLKRREPLGGAAHLGQIRPVRMQHPQDVVVRLQQKVGRVGEWRVIGQPLRWHVAVDRKSTRLNSSHDSISYAVFCLKTKT